MESFAQYYTIKIERNLYSYGFDLKDEGKPYKSYVLVSKITSNLASESGLKVGDKIISINGEIVAGKDYVYLKNAIRKSIENCVQLKVLKEMNSQVIYPEVFNSESTFTPQKQSFGRSLIPSGCIREKISIFQNKPNDAPRRSETVKLSSSCDCIHNSSTRFHIEDNSNLHNILSASAENIRPKAESPQIQSNINQTISQDPFLDDSIHISPDIVQIELPSSFERVISSKSVEHIDISLSPYSCDTLSTQVSEQYNPWSIKGPDISSLMLPDSFTSSYNINSNFLQLSPLTMNKSRSSTNIFSDVTNDWPNESLDCKRNNEFGSMTNIKSTIERDYSNKRQLPRQPSIAKNVPIKLRIVQFFDKKKLRSLTDYILEKEPDGAKFRKRDSYSIKNDDMSDFFIKFEDVNKFEVESPHKLHRGVSGTVDNSSDYLLKYSLMANNSRVHLKFHFNTSMCKSEEYSKQAIATYINIITSFKIAENRKLVDSSKFSLSQSSNINIPRCDSQKCFSTSTELKSSLDDSCSGDLPNYYKSNSKSSTENVSVTFSEASQSSTKSLFKQAIGKIRPERKSKVNRTCHKFIGTKGDLDEFQMQLEGGFLTSDLTAFNEFGTNYGRYIYEVPRMTIDPKIPMIIYLCTEIIEKIGINVEGIYRQSGNKRIIRLLEDNLNKPLDKIDTDLPEWSNVHAIGGALKSFLGKLKQKLIPAELSHVLAYSCKGVDSYDPMSLSKTLLDIRYHLSSYQILYGRDLDKNHRDEVQCHWESLRYIMKHLSKVVSRYHLNKMDERAVSVCFNPVLMESWQQDLANVKADNEIMVKALELILVHQGWLFKDWHSEINHCIGSKLVESAQQYAKEFIDKKYDFNIKLDFIDEMDGDNNFDIHGHVKDILSHAKITVSDKNNLQRRHSSHTPGGRPVILRDNIVSHESFVARRVSQTTDALDLDSCVSWMKQFAKTPHHDDSKSKLYYIPSTDSNSDVSAEPVCEFERFVPRQISLVGRDKRFGAELSDCSNDNCRRL